MDKYTIKDSNGSTTDADIDTEFYGDEYKSFFYTKTDKYAYTPLGMVTIKNSKPNSGAAGNAGQKHAAKNRGKRKRTKRHDCNCDEYYIDPNCPNTIKYE